MADEPTFVVDPRGRKFEIRKLTIEQEMDLYEAAGDLTENRRWMAYATIAATVHSIDGVPFPIRSSKQGLRAAVAQLGADGIGALIEALNKQSEVPTEGESPAAPSLAA